MTKVVFFSDTHCYHESVTVPECDILCFAGDFSSTGKPNEVLSFLNWFSVQPAEHLVFIAGNHDITFESSPKFKERILGMEPYKNIHYLETSGITLCGLNIWGAPYTPEFGNWAFMPTKKELQQIWAKIPENTDVLLTHGPPYGILDTVSFTGEHAGCLDLLDAVLKIRPALHCYGHIHQQPQQIIESNETKFCNVAICDDRYNPTGKPVVIEI